MKMVLVADFHLTAPGESVKGVDPRERAERCLREIGRRQADADLCVIMGDLTNGGEPEGYEILRRLLSGLEIPCRLMIGNHDDRERFRRAFADAPRDEHGFIQSALETPAGRMLFLDTHEPGAGAGSYCARRFEWLGRELARAGEEPVYLFMHHPPFEIGLKFLDRIRLAQGEEFGAFIRPYRNIRHIFCGHVHRSMSGSWQGVPITTLSAVLIQCALDFSEPEKVLPASEPPQYAVVLLRPEGPLVHYQPFCEIGFGA